MIHSQQELEYRALETTIFYVKLGNEILNTCMATPYLDFSLKGECGGSYHGKDHRIRINLTLFDENFEDYIENTIPHEVAHAFVRHKWKRSGFGTSRPKPHGNEWVRIMRQLGKEPTVTHSYDTTNAKTRTWKRPYLYRCACRDHHLTNILHKRVLKGNRYRCGDCNDPILFVGEIQ